MRGYIANKVDQRRTGDRNALEALRNLFGDLLFHVEIPQSIEIRYSQAARSDIYRYKPIVWPRLQWRVWLMKS